MPAGEFPLFFSQSCVSQNIFCSDSPLIAPWISCTAMSHTHSHTREFQSVMWFCPQNAHLQGRSDPQTTIWECISTLELSIQETGFVSAFYLVSLLLMQDSSVTFLDFQGSSLVFLFCMPWSYALFWEGCLDLTSIASLSPSFFSLLLFATFWMFTSTTHVFGFCSLVVVLSFYYMRTEWSLRGKGNYCSRLQPRNPESCKFSCAASMQTNGMDSPSPWQEKSPKETFPGCSSSLIAAVICAIYFLVMQVARRVLVFSCCFVFLRARFRCGGDFALLHWQVWALHCSTWLRLTLKVWESSG